MQPKSIIVILLNLTSWATRSYIMTKPPTYDLDELKTLLSDPSIRIVRRRDRAEAAKLGYPGDDDMVARVLLVKKSEFHKTMEAEACHGLWQDVYKTVEPSGIRLYIKLQKNEEGDGVLISFKEE